MSYRVDKFRVDTQPAAGNDSTRKPKLALGKKFREWHQNCHKHNIFSSVPELIPSKRNSCLHQHIICHRLNSILAQTIHSVNQTQYMYNALWSPGLPVPLWPSSGPLYFGYRLVFSIGILITKIRWSRLILIMGILIQSSTVIMWSNTSWYFTQLCNDSSRIQIRHWASIH